MKQYMVLVRVSTGQFHLVYVEAKHDRSAEHKALVLLGNEKHYYKKQDIEVLAVEFVPFGDKNGILL